VLAHIPPFGYFFFVGLHGRADPNARDADSPDRNQAVGKAIMERRERLMATLQGETVDRPGVCFYEINGLDEKPDDPDPYNIYSDPSWKPLLDLARDRSDRIVMRDVPVAPREPDPVAALTQSEVWEDENGTRFTRTTIRAPRGPLTSLTRRDRDLNTVWVVEHLLKNEDDFQTWLELPEAEEHGLPDVSGVLKAEAELGGAGIVMIDTPDPICLVAQLFDFGTYTVMGLTENALMHRALEKTSRVILPRVNAVARALPGRLWRIYGPEYASPPYLPPRLFEEYVVRYVTPMVGAIQRYGGYARVHCHGRLRDILDHIAATGCDGLDPIEPPGQGDVELAYVRQRYGKQMVLFGNIEVSDIENLPAAEFEKKVAAALREGTEGPGRGFVLMPSACPYGRVLPERTLRNYELMVEMAEGF